MIYGLGGEVGIAKEHVQSIKRAEEIEGLGMVLPGLQQPRGGTTETTESKGTGPGPPGEAKAKRGKPAGSEKRVLTPEEELAEKRAKEEKEYQKRVGEITGRIKALIDRYTLATRGGTGPKPSLLNSEEAIRGRTADLMSRIRDRQFNPAGFSDAAARRLELSRRGVRPRSSVVAGAAPALPPPPSAKERELNDLRKQFT